MKTKALYKTFFGIALTVCSLSSCVNDWLDVTPQDGVDADNAIKNTSDLSTLRAGLYAAVKGNSNLVDYYGRVMFLYGDIQGEDVQYNWIDGSGRASMYYYREYTTQDNFTSSNVPWQTPYVVISRANRLIQAAENDEIEDADENAATVAQYVAEARVLRAMALFDLTRVYGMPYTEDGGASLGASIITETVEDPGTYKPARSTVAECYQQIENDLNTAISSGALYEDNDENIQGYVNLWAAKALQVRVYMTKGEWNNALSMAEDIIENAPYRLWTRDQYVSAWSESNAAHTNEIMLEMVINDNTDWTDREGIAYCYHDAYDPIAPGYGDVIVTKSFSEMMESDPEDVRNGILLQPNGDPADYADYGEDFTEHGVFINKMPATNGDTRYANVPLLRLSEVYLSAAEAAFNLGDRTKAAEYLNDIISNRTTDATKQVTADNVTLDRIYIERRKELVGEGQRYFDVLRRGETVTRYTDDNDRGWHDVLSDDNDARTFNRDSRKALPLIPASEVNTNQNMQQNPLY